MKNDVIQFNEILTILKRNLLRSFLISLFFAIAGYGVAHIVPKRFKTKTVLNIQSSYFQIPLVGDLVANSNDSMEYKAQKEALLRLALNDEFLDQLGEKHRLFKYPRDHWRHDSERDSLLSRIEYYSIGSNSYQINVTAGSAMLAYQIAQDVLNQMISTLVANRLEKLDRARAAVLANLESLKIELAKSGAAEQSKSQNPLLESLEVEESKLAALEQRYTESHPALVQQRNRVARLRSEKRPKNPLQKESFRTSDRKGEGDPNSTSTSKRALQDLHDDMYRKYNYLNIVNDMEKSATERHYLSILEHPNIPLSAVFPKKAAFGIGGGIAGVVVALIIMILVELRRGTFNSPVHVSEIFEAPFLGSLPTWAALEGVRALPAPPPRDEPPPKKE